MARQMPEERATLRRNIKSVIDTSGADPEMVATLRSELARKEKVRVISAPASQAVQKAQSGWNRVVSGIGKLLGYGKKK